MKEGAWRAGLGARDVCRRSPSEGSLGLAWSSKGRDCAHCHPLPASRLTQSSGAGLQSDPCHTSDPRMSPTSWGQRFIFSSLFDSNLVHCKLDLIKIKWWNVCVLSLWIEDDQPAPSGTGPDEGLPDQVLGQQAVGQVCSDQRRLVLLQS